MAAPHEKTRIPGIYRRGTRYVVRLRDRRGHQFSRSATTMAEAKELLAIMRADVARGEFRVQSRTGFASHARDWIATYTGRTSRGFKEHTRDDYRRILELHAIPYFKNLAVGEIEPRDIKAFAKHVSDKRTAIGTDRERHLSPNAVRLAVAPVKALLATAFEDGMIRANPAANVRIAQPMPGHETTRSKALTEAELRLLLVQVPDNWKLFIRLLACTGIRIGEAIALQWRDIDLDQATLQVRRTVYKGTLGSPKSRYGVRTIPLVAPLCSGLRLHRLESGVPSDESPIFATGCGTMHLPSNLARRVMKPAAKAAGVPWASFHTLRHTFASQVFRSGCSIKQVQHLLGHHSASFTLDRYVHLMADDRPDLEFLGAVARW